MSADRPMPATAEAVAAAEMARAACDALENLPADLRLAVSLCCEQGLSHREAGEILDVPEKTVTDRVRRGLERLRQILTAAGFAGCAPAALATSLGALGVPAAPAGVLAKIQELAGGTGASTIGVGTGSGAAGAAKGGLIVKIGLGIAAAGLVAGTAFWAVGGGAESPPVAAAEKKSKFDTPVWHPDARWEREIWCHGGKYSDIGGGNVDGPRMEVLWDQVSPPLPAFQVTGPIKMLYHDDRADRIHSVTRGARGTLDGPFSRARWGGSSYGALGLVVVTPDRRYCYVTDPYNRGALRVFDFKEQMVSTVTEIASLSIQAATMNSKGHLVLLVSGGRLVTLDPAASAGKRIVSDVKIKDVPLGRGAGIALDEVHNRLYCTGGLAEKKWFVWYLDLNDGGTFHGVLAGKETGPRGAYCGPFDNYEGYAECSVYFGPDDPNKRFLYMRATDTGGFMRLDLERRMVAAFASPPRNQKGTYLFIESGNQHEGSHSAHTGPSWLPNGDFYVPGYITQYYRRVK